MSKTNILQRTGSHRRAVILCGLSVMVFPACRPTGVWQLTRTEPPGVEFPLQRLELDRSGQFRATSKHQGQQLQTHGQYQWSFDSLRVGRPGFEERSYKVRRSRNGRLEFAFEQNGRKVIALFERVDPKAERREGSTPSVAEESTGVPDNTATPNP